MVTLKQIEAFYWASALGSFEAAAARLNTAQSTISKRIQEFEANFTTMLFDRTKRSVRLTMKGQEILKLVEEMLSLQHRMARAAEAPEEFSGRFRFGVTELIALTWLPDLVSAIKTAYPRIVLEPEVDMGINLYERLAEHSIDLAIGPRLAHDARLASLPLTSVEQAWMCSPALHPGNSVVPLSKITEFPLLTQTERSGLQVVIMRLLKENGVRINRIISCNSMVALAELAASGFGVTTLPRHYFAPDLKSGRLKILRTLPALPKLEYVAVHRSDDTGTISAMIARMAKDACDFGMPRRLRARP